MEINMLNVFRLFLFFYKEIISAKNDLKWEGNNSECTQNRSNFFSYIHLALPNRLIKKDNSAAPDR